MRLTAQQYRSQNRAAKPKQAPEEDLQVRAANYLRANLPPDFPWGAVESSNRGKRDGARQKAKGVNPGFMDFQFFLPPYATYLGLEAKSPTGSPSDAQKEMGARLQGVGGYWFPFKTLGDLEYVLRSFGVKLRTRTMEKPRPHLVKLVEATDLSRFEWAAP